MIKENLKSNYQTHSSVEKDCQVSDGNRNTR